jgi:hypothetical protein
MKLLRESWKQAAQVCGIVVVCVALAGCKAAAPASSHVPIATYQRQPAPVAFSFITAGDMRNYVGPAPAGKRYFDGLCEALQTIGAGSFMIIPGDCDPPGPVRATIDRYLGTNYVWYPVIGNHELGTGTNLAWLREQARAGIPHLTRRGPPGAEETTYSFEFENSHFIALDEYYNGTSDSLLNNDIPEAAFDWLEKDLAATRKPLIWVIGHVPIKSLPDMDTGRKRHEGGSLTTNPAHLERFLQLLKKYHVRAYICGHTHDCSVARVSDVWQADSGHARGGGDTGAPSTFLKFRVLGERTWVDVYRGDTNGVTYQLRKTVELD